MQETTSDTIQNKGIALGATISYNQYKEGQSMMKETTTKSPRFAHFHLLASLEHTGAIFQEFGQGEFNREGAHECWNLARGAVRGRRQLSTMLEFGLIEQTSRRGGGLFGFTKRFLDTKVSHDPTREAALRECALHPKVYASLWAEFGDELEFAHTEEDRAATVATIYSYLTTVYEERFSKRGARLMLPNFMETLMQIGLIPYAPAPILARTEGEMPMRDVSAPTKPLIQFYINTDETVTFVVKLHLKHTPTVFSTLQKAMEVLQPVVASEGGQGGDSEIGRVRRKRVRQNK